MLDKTKDDDKLPKIKWTKEFPEDEDFAVFLTAVPSAPFQVIGQKTESGELYVHKLISSPENAPNLLPSDVLSDDVQAQIELLTGAEAEKLIAAIIAQG
jgi:hypothetical protein